MKPAKPRALAIPCYVVPQYGRVEFHPCKMGGVIDHALRVPGLWRVFVQFEGSASRSKPKAIGALWFPTNVENFVKDHPGTRPVPNAAVAAFYLLKALALYDGLPIYTYADPQSWPKP
jgi:hypothetical protein